jgi:hypothetical protein
MSDGPAAATAVEVAVARVVLGESPHFDDLGVDFTYRKWNTHQFLRMDVGSGTEATAFLRPDTRSDWPATPETWVTVPLLTEVAREHRLSAHAAATEIVRQMAQVQNPPMPMDE